MLRRWMWGLLSAGWLTTTGCICHLSSIPPVEEDIREACDAIALDSRCHVHVLFIQGIDPVDCAGLEGLKETTQALGFPNAWYGHSCHISTFKKVLAQIQKDDPKARFVLVGYALGVETAASLARTVAAQEIHFDLLVGLAYRVETPSTVARQLTLMPCGKGLDLPDVFEVPTKSLGLASHPMTVEILARELFALAGSIPAEAPLPKMHYPEEPRPRPVMPPAEGVRDEWDFLKPMYVDDRDRLPAPKKKPGLRSVSRKAS
jgi:hypothetical protein